jgi:hypothetical protein
LEKLNQLLSFFLEFVLDFDVREAQPKLIVVVTRASKVMARFIVLTVGIVMKFSILMNQRQTRGLDDNHRTRRDRMRN